MRESHPWDLTPRTTPVTRILQQQQQQQVHDSEADKRRAAERSGEGRAKPRGAFAPFPEFNPGNSTASNSIAAAAAATTTTVEDGDETCANARAAGKRGRAEAAREEPEAAAA